MWQEMAKVINRQNGSNHHRDRQIAAQRGREPQGGGRKDNAGAAGHRARAGAQGPRHPDEHGSRHESARRRGEREAPEKKAGATQQASKPPPPPEEKESKPQRGGEDKRPRAAPVRARETTQKNENATRGAGKAGDETEEGERRDARTADRQTKDLRSTEYGGGVCGAG